MLINVPTIKPAKIKIITAFWIFIENIFENITLAIRVAIRTILHSFFPNPTTTAEKNRMRCFADLFFTNTDATNEKQNNPTYKAPDVLSICIKVELFRAIGDKDSNTIMIKR